MRTCRECSVEKPESEFYLTTYGKKKGIDIRARICKICQQIYNKKRLENPKIRADYLNYQKKYRNPGGDGYEEKMKRAKEVRDMVLEIKTKTPCKDCNNIFHPACMEFDHILGEKYKNISYLSTGSFSKEKVLAEIAKCELVCANCHRVRTVTRGAYPNWYPQNG